MSDWIDWFFFTPADHTSQTSLLNYLIELLSNSFLSINALLCKRILLIILAVCVKKRLSRLFHDDWIPSEEWSLCIIGWSSTNFFFWNLKLDFKEITKNARNSFILRRNSIATLLYTAAIYVRLFEPFENLSSNSNSIPLHLKSCIISPLAFHNSIPKGQCWF